MQGCTSRGALVSGAVKAVCWARRQAAAAGGRLLARLRVYAAAAQFQVAAEGLARSIIAPPPPDGDAAAAAAAEVAAAQAQATAAGKRARARPLTLSWVAPATCGLFGRKRAFSSTLALLMFCVNSWHSRNQAQNWNAHRTLVCSVFKRSSQNSHVLLQARCAALSRDLHAAPTFYLSLRRPGAALGELAAALTGSATAAAPPAPPPAVAAHQPAGAQLPRPAEPDAAALAALAARRTLALLAAALHAPALHAAAAARDGGGQGAALLQARLRCRPDTAASGRGAAAAGRHGAWPAGVGCATVALLYIFLCIIGSRAPLSRRAARQRAPGAQAHLGAPLLAGARRLLGVLAGSRRGLALLLADGGALRALLAALDPGPPPWGGPALGPAAADPPPRGSAAEAAAALRAALAAAQAAGVLAGGGGGAWQGFGPADAARELAEGLACERGRRAAVQALALAPGALAALLGLVEARARARPELPEIQYVCALRWPGTAGMHENS